MSRRDSPWRPVRLGDLTPVVDERPDGSIVLRAAQPLGSYPAALTDRLVQWAAHAPDRTLLGWAATGIGPLSHPPSRRTFECLSYRSAVEKMRAVGQALLDRKLSAERPLAILAGNSAEHLILALAAQHVGVPYAPVSPAYSLVSRDFATLRHVVGALSPGLVYVSDATRFAPAITATLATDVEIVHAGHDATALAGRPVRHFNDLLETQPTAAVDERHASVEPDVIAKILFTSGSTGVPKGVINTHRMICSNQQMILQSLPFLGDEPPVLVDWLPWHHTFGGNHNIGIAIYNGGSLYIDEGRPMPGAFDESVRNLREIVPTIYLNVPKGYEELVRAFRSDADLAARFFSRVQVLFYAAAGLSQHLADELQRIAVDTCGERLILVTGLGATETAPMAICRPWPSDLSAEIGVPVPGVEAKLVPTGEKLEVRVRGPNVTPGYWRQEAETRAAFDEEGYYCMGDAAAPVDPRDVGKGLVFDGRLKEDFKLSTGTWVSVGPLRARILAHFAPYVRDVVITGHDRDEIGMLIVPEVDACRALGSDLPPAAPVAAVVGHAAVREEIRERLRRFAMLSTGSATRPRRALVLVAPLSLDAGEVTDKGSLNQRAILDRRRDLVDELYAALPPPHVILEDA